MNLDRANELQKRLETAIANGGSKDQAEPKLIAKIIDDGCDLGKYADRVNAGRTDDIKFYVNRKNVTVSHVYHQLPTDDQLKELQWFLDGRDYQIEMINWNNETEVEIVEDDLDSGINDEPYHSIFNQGGKRIK